MGDLYKDKDCYIETLAYTIPDDATWEIGIDQLQRNEQSDWIRNAEYSNLTYLATNDSDVEDYTSKNIKNYKLQSVIEVAISLKIVDDRKSIEGYKFYSDSPIMQKTAQILEEKREYDPYKN